MSNKTETWDRTGIKEAIAIIGEIFPENDDCDLNVCVTHLRENIDRLRAAIRSIYTVTHNEDIKINVDTTEARDFIADLKARSVNATNAEMEREVLREALETERDELKRRLALRACFSTKTSTGTLIKNYVYMLLAENQTILSGILEAAAGRTEMTDSELFAALDTAFFRKYG